MTTRNDLSFITTGDGARLAYRFDGTAGKPVLLLSNSIGTCAASPPTRACCVRHPPACPLALKWTWPT